MRRSAVAGKSRNTGEWTCCFARKDAIERTYYERGKPCATKSRYRAITSCYSDVYYSNTDHVNSGVTLSQSQFLIVISILQTFTFGSATDT